jgi:hypothetical protein
MPFWGTEPPENAHEDELQKEIAVWGAMSSQGLIGPKLFE